MRVADPRPLTLGPLLEYLAGRECSRVAAPLGKKCTRPGCMRAVSEATGVHRGLLHRWAREGVTLAIADRLAVALDVHPSAVWGVDGWNAALDAHDEELDRRARRARRRALARERARALAAA